MKKFTLYIIAALAIFSIAYTIGYYVGHNISYVKNTETTQQNPDTSTLIVPEADIESLKKSLEQEKAKSTKLQQELKQQKQQVAQLKKTNQQHSSSSAEKVLPASDYDRGNYVTNLVHFFNSGKNTTQVSDIQCEANTCQLTANISAGANTNPEISQLMKFFDEHSKAGLYTHVALSSVEKKQDGSEVVLNLSL